MVFAVNEGIVYISATAPDSDKRADMVLTVGNDAEGAHAVCICVHLHFPAGAARPPLRGQSSGKV